MTPAAKRWQAVKISDFERRQMRALRAELDQEYEVENGLSNGPLKGQASAGFIQQVSDLTPRLLVGRQ